MDRPAIILVDDDIAVLQAVEQDIRSRYGKQYRILKAESGAQAIELVKQLRVRHHALALLLVDQRMPHMTGIEFLERATQIFPDSKRALLTAYADTDAAISAINAVGIDYYLMKPWDPPEVHLYPVIEDLLSDWMAHYRPAFRGIRVLGHRWSSQSHYIRDFLARNQISYQVLDVDAPESQSLSDLANLDLSQLPIVMFPDGSSLVAPTNTQLAQKIGLHTQAGRPFYDLIIIGAGPAGLAAAVYGASEGLALLLIEREASGGQAGTSSRIENYLGFPMGLSGGDLTRRAVTQARRFGAEILVPLEVQTIGARGQYRYVTLSDGTELSCHALIIATGVSHRRLDVPGIERLTGAGVYYNGALAEAMTCQGQDVYMVGGANSSGQAALHFARYAHSVTLLIRDEDLSRAMSHYLIEAISATSNILVQPHTQVIEAHGEERLEALTIQNIKTGEAQTFTANLLFIYIGATPHTAWLSHILERDPQGFLLTGPHLPPAQKQTYPWPLERPPYLLESNIPGIFIAGDVRHGSIKRVASAVGEGAMAIQFVHQYLKSVM